MIKEFLINIIKNLFLDGRSYRENIDEYLLCVFSLLIIVCGLLNILSNKAYISDILTIEDWLTNYQGVFIRIYHIGARIYLLFNVIEVSPLFIVWLIIISSYYLSLKFTILESKNKFSNVFLPSSGILLAPLIGDFLIRKDLLLHISKTYASRKTKFCLLKFFWK